MCDDDDEMMVFSKLGEEEDDGGYDGDHCHRSGPSIWEHSHPVVIN